MRQTAYWLKSHYDMCITCRFVLYKTELSTQLEWESKQVPGPSHIMHISPWPAHSLLNSWIWNNNGAGHAPPEGLSVWGFGHLHWFFFNSRFFRKHKYLPWQLVCHMTCYKLLGNLLRGNDPPMWKRHPAPPEAVWASKAGRAGSSLLWERELHFPAVASNPSFFFSWEQLKTWLHKSYQKK